MSAEDIWSKWLLKTRFGGNAEVARLMLERLQRVRDRVLDNAQLRPGATLLDVGTGDGLIAFGALERLGSEGSVIFSDVSEPLLDRCRELAREAGGESRCRFVTSPAETLAGVDDRSVDAVTTRSVLIYVKDKAAAFDAFQRVLRPGGRISLFEPINNYFAMDGSASFLGFSDEGVSDLTERLREFFRGLQPPDSDPMMDFGERDLLQLSQDAGFEDIQVSLELNSSRMPPVPWTVLLGMAGNPRIPSLGEALELALTEDERARFERHVRPTVERGGRIMKDAVAYVRAVKPSEEAASSA